MLVDVRLSFCALKLITRVLQISSDELSPSPVLTLQVSFRQMRGLWFSDTLVEK